MKPQMKRRDPRFQSMEEGDAKYFREQYAFIGELRRQELQEDRARLKEMEADPKLRGSEEYRQLKARVMREKQQVGEMDRKRLEVDLRNRLAEAELEAVAHGKRAYYVKEAEIKRLTTAMRYSQLAGTRKGERLLTKVHERRGRGKRD